MDFLDPQKKRARNIRLYIGYALMGIALTIGTTILVFAAYGFDINRKTGEVIQNGLIRIDAHPESATIYVNGVNKGTTENRLILPAGKYSVELKRDDYRSWKHDVNLEGSNIEQLVYPFLFPTKLVTSSFHTYDKTPSMTTQSPDRRWLVVHRPGTANGFDLVDLNETKNKTTAINLPADAFTVADTEGVHSFEAIEWSTDNVHLLMKHTFSTGVEFIILDRETLANSINLNKILGQQQFTNVSMIDKKPTQLYLFDGASGNLFQSDTNTKLTTPVQSKVISYKSYQNNVILYVANPLSSPNEVEVRLKVDKQDFLLHSLPKADKYLLDMAKFDGDFYLLSGSTADGSVHIYKNPIEDLTAKPSITPTPFRVLILPGGNFVSFSAIARIVALQSGSKFAVYDLETDRQLRYDTQLPTVADKPATWMDGHRLTMVSENVVSVFDFDGTNLQKLSASSPLYTPFFDRDYTAMFTLDTNADKTNLSRTGLKVLPILQKQ